MIELCSFLSLLSFANIRDGVVRLALALRMLESGSSGRVEVTCSYVRYYGGWLLFTNMLNGDITA